jgi:serine/threonine-protein kinase
LQYTLNKENRQVQPATRLGPYEVLAQIGSGGMGEVYRARDTRLGRDVAIKVLPAEFASDPDRLRRFEQEARAVAALDHPNILAIHDIGTHEGAPYIVAELLEGESLRERLSGGAMPVRKAVEFAVQIAQGLAAAHEKGIVHRDLKPANVFVTKDGHVKILDFGIAKLIAPRSLTEPAQATTVAEATEAGVALGTVGYMSPEQVRGLPVDHRTDIFAFGCVLYEMLAGRRPFTAATNADTVAAILSADPRPLAEAGTEIPRGLEAIVLRCLEKRSEDRFTSARDVAFALLAFERSGETPSRATSPRGTTRDDRPSIAVLPFEDMSPGHDQEYLCDGIAEELISALTRIEGLRVIARTSAFAFKGQRLDVREIGSRLGVGSLLEGSVRKAGQRLRISAQLIDVRDGSHLWAERYERELNDIFEIQDEICQAIAGRLRAALLEEPGPAFVPRRASDPGAYRFYLQARFFFNQRKQESVRKSLEYYLQAIELDPRFALAWAGLSEVYEMLGSWRALPLHDAYDQARAAAARAVELDESLAEAHIALASTRMFCDWDWAGAEREFKRALKINPVCPDGHHLFAHWYEAMGRFGESLAEMSAALEVEPVAPSLHSCLVQTLVHARRYDEAVHEGSVTLEMAPNWTGTYGWMGVAHLLSGKVEVGLEMLREGLRQRPGDPRLEALLGTGQVLVGDREGAQRCVERLDATGREKYVDPYFMVWPRAALGETDAAFSKLTEACNEHSQWAYVVKVDPLLDNLRADRRFGATLERMGLAG